MVSKNLNGLYPPMDGFLNVLYRLSCDALKEMVFDRYQKGKRLGGSFASPMKADGTPYDFASRALDPKGVYTNRIRFKLIDPCKLGISFTFGEVLKWYEMKGGAIQIKSNINFNLLKEGEHYEVIENLKLVE